VQDPSPLRIVESVVFFFGPLLLLIHATRQRLFGLDSRKKRRSPLPRGSISPSYSPLFRDFLFFSIADRRLLGNFALVVRLVHSFLSNMLLPFGEAPLNLFLPLRLGDRLVRTLGWRRLGRY